MADEERKQRVKDIFEGLTINFNDWNALERELIRNKFTQEDLYTFETFSLFVKNCLRGN
jgi:hypothetical protein